MTETCLTFTNQSDADIANDKIWYNEIINIASDDYRLISDGGSNHYYLSDLQSMTEAQVIDLCICGTKGNDIAGNPIIEYYCGFTTGYAQVKECYDISGKFFFKKPDNFLMTGVVSYTEESLDPNWFPPSED